MMVPVRSDWLIRLTDRTGPIIARTREGETKDGMRVYEAFSRPAVSGWRVAIAAPVSIVDAPLRDQLMWLVIVGTFFALLGMVIAGMIGRRMAQPILSLSAAAESDRDRKSTRLNSSHSQISYAVFCLKKKKKQQIVAYSTDYNVSRHR